MKTKTIILLFLIVFLTAFFTVSKAQPQKVQYYFKERSWANLDYIFYMDFRNDSILVKEGDSLYVGLYMINNKFLAYGDELFEIHKGLIGDAYYLINDRRIIVLHENRDKTIKYW